MKEIIIDGEKIDDMADIHSFFAKELSFPEWYGNNLDALRDCLTDISYEITVTVINRDMLFEKLNVRYGRFLKTLEYSEKENENIKIVLK